MKTWHCYLPECDRDATESRDVLVPPLYDDPETVYRIWGCAEHIGGAPYWLAEGFGIGTGRRFVAVDDGMWRLLNDALGKFRL